MPEVERSLEKAPMLARTDSLYIESYKLELLLPPEKDTEYIGVSRDIIGTNFSHLPVHILEARGRNSLGWDIISGIIKGLSTPNKTLWQYLANKTSYECMRDNLHKRPRRRRKHGGRKGEWIR